MQRTFVIIAAACRNTTGGLMFAVKLEKRLLNLSGVGLCMNVQTVGLSQYAGLR